MSYLEFLRLAGIVLISSLKQSSNHSTSSMTIYEYQTQPSLSQTKPNSDPTTCLPIYEIPISFGRPNFSHSTSFPTHSFKPLYNSTDSLSAPTRLEENEQVQTLSRDSSNSSNPLKYLTCSDASSRLISTRLGRTHSMP